MSDLLTALKLASNLLMKGTQPTKQQSDTILKAIAEEEEKQNRIEWTRVNNDGNGNPRYVCHFLNFITDKDSDTIGGKYDLALRRARKLGGGKFNNKQYGGGIVFQSYNIQETERKIKELIAAL